MPPPCSAQAQEKFTYLTNWYAQAEHGGFYQALATGLYKKEGLDVTIRMGGPQVNGMQLLAAGQADCFMVYDVQTMKALGERHSTPSPWPPPFQKDPQVLIGHPGVVNKMEDLKGKTILISAATANNTYWPCLMATYKLDAVAGAALHLQHPALHRRQERGAAGLPVERALRHREGSQVQAQRLPAG